MKLARQSTVPTPVGNTRFSVPFGHCNFHSRKVFTTISSMGIVRAPGQRRRQQKGSALSGLSRADNPSNLVPCGNVAADLWLSFYSAVASDRNIRRHVLRDIPATFGVLKDRLEACKNLLSHWSGHGLNQFVPKGLDTRRGQFRQPLISNAGDDMESSVLTV